MIRQGMLMEDIFGILDVAQEFWGSKEVVNSTLSPQSLVLHENKGDDG